MTRTDWWRMTVRRLLREITLRRTVVFVVVAGVLGLMVANTSGRPRNPTSAELCAGSRKAVEELKRELAPPEETVRSLEEQAEQACDAGFQTVPEAPPLPAAASPGCEALDERRPVAVPRTTVAAPRAAVPYFAPRPGALPRDGAATVAGVELPAGSRCPHYWATDAPFDGAAEAAERLAEAFPRTGLWPVLWSHGWESPDAYAAPVSDPRAAAGLDARRILGAGLASGSFAGGRPDEPFRSAADSIREPGAALLLVPATRPADAVPMLGVIQSEIHTEEELGAVLRSWEERFGAVVTAIGPGTLELAVAAPAGDGEHAEAVAEEHEAFAPDADVGPQAEARAWRFGWPD